MKNSVFVIILTSTSIILMYSKKWGLHLVGGSGELTDRDLLETVERETLEETGIRLTDRRKFKHLISRSTKYNNVEFNENILMYQVNESDVKHIPKLHKSTMLMLINKVRSGEIKEFAFRVANDMYDLTNLSDAYYMSGRESDVYSYLSTTLEYLNVIDRAGLIKLYNSYDGIDIIKQREYNILTERRIHNKVKSDYDDRMITRGEIIEKVIIDDFMENLDDLKSCPLVCECSIHHKYINHESLNMTSYYRKFRNLLF